MQGPSNLLSVAAQWIADADAFIVGAGAGMSVGSGLEAYYGAGGRYADHERLAAANAAQFAADTEAAVDRAVAEFRAVVMAEPHVGYQILREWAERAPFGAFVFTSNVDSLFTTAGFEADAM